MVEIEQVQGNVLYAYGPEYRFAHYAMLEFADREQALEALGRWHSRITFGKPKAPRDPPYHVNVAFTFAGLEVLELPEEWLASFPEDFREGSRCRSDQVGDRGASHADNWWRGNKGAVHHALVVVHAKRGAKLDTLVGELCRGFKRVWDRPAALLDRGAHGNAGGEDSCNTRFSREHFGFADGCSQPAIEGIHDDPMGDGLYARRPFGWWRALRWLELVTEDLGIRQVPRRWRAIRVGEFMLGYENEDGELPEGPPAPLGPNGTFMVYRELDQHVDAFDEFVRESAREVRQVERGKPAEDRAAAPKVDLDGLLRAKIVGRWPKGTPLALSADGEDNVIASDRRRANNFLYREDRDGYRADPEGLRCPLGAHVRRTNPRDALPGGAERTMRHRIIRRGMPYGNVESRAYSAVRGTGNREHYENGGEGSTPVRAERRGLAFVCFSSSIANGFEFIQHQWCDGGTALGLGGDRDLLLQQADLDPDAGRPTGMTGMVIPAGEGKTIVLKPPARPFVTVRGCEYLFLPSRRAYAWLMNPDT